MLPLYAAAHDEDALIPPYPLDYKVNSAARWIVTKLNRVPQVRE